MTVVSLDQIVKNILLTRKYSFHWYLEFLVHTKNILRELCFDCNIIAGRYQLLPVENFRVDLPTDYVDYTRVSVRVDQYIHPLTEDDALQLVPNYNDDFEVSPYSEGVQTMPNGSGISGFYTGYAYPFSTWFMTGWNNWGESVGRTFGGVGSYIDTFRVDKYANQIKINEQLCGVTELLLEYISNGMDADSATHIDAYAQEAITAGAMWQFKENNRTYSAGEAEAERQKYIQQVQILRARLSNLTIDNLKRLIQKNQRGIQY
jgi:hypothetical protein